MACQTLKKLKNQFQKYLKNKNMLFFHNPKGTFYHVLLTAIAVIMVWRGIWNLLDEYMIIENSLISNIVRRSILNF